MTDVIVEMEQEAAALLERAQAAREAAEAARRKADEEERQRRDDWDRAELAAYDPAAWEKRVTDARTAFLKALSKEPWADAWVRLEATRMSWRQASTNVTSTFDRLGGGGGPRPVEEATTSATFAEELVAALQQLASNVAVDESDERDARRDAAARGEAWTS
jgi:hypothetical protein